MYAVSLEGINLLIDSVLAPTLLERSEDIQVPRVTWPRSVFLLRICWCVWKLGEGLKV